VILSKRSFAARSKDGAGAIIFALAVLYARAREAWLRAPSSAPFEQGYRAAGNRRKAFARYGETPAWLRSSRLAYRGLPYPTPTPIPGILPGLTGGQRGAARHISNIVITNNNI
jgi:hypothetical protein